MEEVPKVAASVGATVIEDAAQVIGALCDRSISGTMGLVSTYYFYPAKMLGCVGDGGAVLTDDAALAKEVRRLRGHGRVTKAEVDGCRCNCRLDNLQAATLDYPLKQFPLWIDHRCKLASIYQEMLRGIEEPNLPIGPDADPRRRDVFQNHTVMIVKRDELYEHPEGDGHRGTHLVARPVAQADPHGSRALGPAQHRAPQRPRAFLAHERRTGGVAGRVRRQLGVPVLRQVS